MAMSSDSRMAVFVVSSDSRQDVFRAVAPCFGLYWPDCPYVKYVGLNSPLEEQPVAGFRPVFAPVLGWRDELRIQLSQLSEEFILLWLDDFLLLRPVSTVRVERLRLLAGEGSLNYLRLIEIERSFAVRLVARLLASVQEREYVPVPTGVPYYSSLQAAIWRRKHLLDMLDSYGEQTIFGFEHHALPGRQHFAVVGSPPIRYTHLVEKGRWLPYAKRVLEAAGLELAGSDRPTWPAWYRVIHWKNRLMFAMVGYAGMRLKAFLRRQ